MGTWEHIDAGICLVEHDRRLSRLSVIVSGKADVRLDGEKVAELGDGQFVGQIAYNHWREGPRQHLSQRVDAHHLVVTRQARDVFQRQARCGTAAGP